MNGYAQRFVLRIIRTSIRTAITQLDELYVATDDRRYREIARLLDNIDALLYQHIESLMDKD